MSEHPRQRKYFLISLALHLGLFLFVAVGGLISPDKPSLMLPAVQIDMVALPDQVKQEAKQVDVSLPVKEDVAPPPAPPEPEPEPEAMRAPEKPEKVVKKDPPKTKEAEKRAKSALEQLREQMESEQRRDEAKRRAAMEKRKSDLKQFEERYRAAIRGNQTNQGTSDSGSLEATANAYAAHLRDRLRANWNLPAWLQNQGLRAKTILYLDARGNVVRMNFVRGSGNEAFDNYVRSAVQRSSPFAPPPEEMSRGLRSSGIEVSFPEEE